jgi:hypothetical protein
VPFTARTSFRRVHAVGEAAALRRALPMAARWLAGDTDRPVPPGSLGGAAAIERLAEITEAGLEPWQRDHLACFAIRVGARRLADAAACLASISQDKAAAIADEQAWLVGALQYPLVTGDRATVARLLRRLAPLYAKLRASLPAAEPVRHRCRGGARSERPVTTNQVISAATRAGAAGWPGITASTPRHRSAATRPRMSRRTGRP